MDDFKFEDHFTTEEVQQKKQNYSYIPGHLSSPITNDDAEFLLKYKNFYCHRHKVLKEIIDKEKIDKTIYSGDCHPYTCLERWVRSLRPDPHSAEKRLKTIISTAFDYSTTQITNHLSSFQTKNCNHIKVIQKEQEQMKQYFLENIKIFLPSYLDLLASETVKDTLCYKRINYGSLLKYHNIRLDKEVFILNCDIHGKCLGPTNLLLSVLDNMQARFSLLLYWKRSDLQTKYKSSMYSEGTKLIESFERIRSTHLHLVYKVISLWESMIVGYSIKSPETDLGFSTLFDDSFSEIVKLLSPTYSSDELISMLLPANETEDNIKLYLELTGITKIFGHPCLSVKSSIDNMKEVSCPKAQIDTGVVENALGVFIRDFCQNYFKKHRRWPNMKSYPADFGNFISKNLVMPKSFSNRWNLWSKIKFDKCFEYDYSVDTTELLKDTASAPPFSEWFLAYDHCAFKHLHNKNKPFLPKNKKPTPLRIISRFLQGIPNEVEKKVFECTELYWHIDDSTAVVCLKEREIKNDGRLFVKQTYEQRLGQVSSEMNIANTIFRYIPDQTMTDSEVILAQKISSAVKNQNQDYELINLDLSKWNSSYRHALVTRFGKTLDQLFGLKNFYEYNHIWFLKANVFTNSRLHPPDYDIFTKLPIPGDYYYNNHKGGMEGMRQKLWTIITIAIIKYSAETLNLRITVIGQGDNQVVLIKYREDQIDKKSELRNRFLQLLKTNFLAVNLKLKLSETWISKNLFEYGKVRYYKGEAISQTTKKISRLIPDINDGISSFMSSLSTINTITESAAKMDHCPDSCFLINSISILNYLMRRKIIHQDTPSPVCFMYLCYPSDFGGISLSHYFSHYVRGHEDKVTMWLAYYNHLRLYYPMNFEYLAHIINLIPSGKKNINRLIEDIYCLDVITLPSIEALFKEKALDYLKSDEVTNPEIKKLFDSNQCISQQELIDQLKTMKPMFLPLAHEILRHSNAGILIAFRNKLSNIATINKIIQSSEENSYLELMAVNNDAVREILISKARSRKRYSLRDSLIKENCPTQLAINIRNEHWNLDLLGASKPVPHHQFTIKPLDECTQEEINMSILINTSREFAQSDLGAYNQLGPFPIFHGAATKEKINKPKMEMFTKSSYTKSLQQLFTIGTWIQKIQGNNLMQLIENLILEKSSHIPEEFLDQELDDWCVSTYGGNMVHRFRAAIERNSAVINSLPTTGSHFRQTTNMLSAITKGGRDWTIHFQLVFLFNVSVISRLKRSIPLLYTQYAAYLSCNTCTQEVSNIVMDIDPITQYYSDTKPIFQPLSSSSTISCHPVYPEFLLRKYLSIHLGRLIGLTFDSAFISTHIDQGGEGSRGSTKKSLQLSINDLRGVNFHDLIIGLLQSSHQLRDLIKEFSSTGVVYSTNQSLSSFAQLLIDANLINELIVFLDVQGYRHYQMIKAEDLSEILVIGIYFYYQKHKKELLIEILSNNFLSEDVNRIYSRYTWTYAEIKRNKFASNVINKYYERSQSYQRNIVMELIMRTLISITNHPHHNIRINIRAEDTIIMWRAYLIQHPDFDRKRPVPIPEITTTPINIEMDNYIKYYNSLCSFQEDGTKHIKNLHHLCRIEGNISSAFTKIHEVYMTLKLDTYCPTSIVCLAEGSGSIINGLSILYPKADLYYNTWLVSDIDLRNGPDQNYPPSYINSPYYNNNRLKGATRLAMGQTDITSSTFITKFKQELSKTQIGLFTLDAESMESQGTNENFLSIYLPILVEMDFNIAIFKMFIDSRSRIYVIEYLQKFSTIMYCFFKPISSNPNNNEVYLTISNKRINKLNIITNTISQFHDRTRYSLSFLDYKPISTWEGIKLYIEQSEILSNLLLTFNIPLNDALIFPDRFTPIIKSKIFCGTYCIKFIVSCFELIEAINTNIEKISIYTILRTSNTLLSLTQISKDVVFSLFYYITLSKLNSLKLIENIDITEDTIRSNTILSTTDTSFKFTELWSNGKLMFKRLSIPPKSCNCSLHETKRIKIAKKSLSSKLFSETRNHIKTTFPEKRFHLIHPKTIFIIEE
ncbi:RNA-dependent RNA polymerase [Hubei diptera virus 11]|uniref:Replicase n=1 Tax=Hubei diptera virus 11 TaxID=1922872 RepID=A0A1L3KN31_9MONO|nr:RNA-dependent RNA polymerase [Hubei diptera virus 11]APG78739.1 RNA-dependent RNA polymerase [Hubei diptera virus 11]